MKAALQATAAENVKLLRDIAQLEMDRDRLEARVRKAEAARAELSESAAALGERYRAEITHIKGRASSELRSVVEKYAEEVRALQDAREAAVLETEKAHAEARDVTAAYEELLTR